jgi:hypothetical protein
LLVSHSLPYSNPTTSRAALIEKWKGDRVQSYVKSCGCVLKKTKAYRAWRGIRYRCTVRTAHNYSDYGGRGIKVCEAWLSSFANFFADMGAPLPGQSIDRIDNSVGYFRENCRWTDSFTQARNKRNNAYVTAFGETKSLSAWAEDDRCVVKLSALTKRIRCMGWDAERAIITPRANTGPRGADSWCADRRTHNGESNAIA